jgi:hypothetical protein
MDMLCELAAAITLLGDELTEIEDNIKQHQGVAGHRAYLARLTARMVEHTAQQLGLTGLQLDVDGLINQMIREQAVGTYEEQRVLDAEEVTLEGELKREEEDNAEFIQSAYSRAIARTHVWVARSEDGRLTMHLQRPRFVRLFGEAAQWYSGTNNAGLNITDDEEAREALSELTFANSPQEVSLYLFEPIMHEGTRYPTNEETFPQKKSTHHLTDDEDGNL